MIFFDLQTNILNDKLKNLIKFIIIGIFVFLISLIPFQKHVFADDFNDSIRFYDDIPFGNDLEINHNFKYIKRKIKSKINIMKSDMEDHIEYIKQKYEGKKSTNIASPVFEDTIVRGDVIIYIETDDITILNE